MSLAAWMRNPTTLLLAIFIGIAFTLLPESAQAVVVGNFSCSGGQATGQLYDTGNGTCPATMQFTNVFSFLICHTEQLSANLMGSMYCGIIAQLQPAVTAMVTLSVLFFGASFTMGFTQITAKDFQAMLLKIALVYAFATQSDLIIGIGYNLLVTGLRDGTAIAVGSLYTANGTPTTGLGVYGLLDKFLGGAMHFATDAIGQTWTNGQNPCKNAVFAVMALIAVVLPPVFYLCIMLIIRIALSFVRAVFSYLYSLIGITFFLCLSPIFLSFFLFKRTDGFFKKWLTQLIAFSLQIVITFAFLAFAVSIKVDTITSSLTTVIMPTMETHEGVAIRWPWKYCTVCQFDVVDSSGALITNDADFLSKGRLQCHDNPPQPISALEANAPQHTAQQNALLKFATHGLIALFILAYIVDTLLEIIPGLSQNLASGFDQSATGLPGAGMLGTIERGFTTEFASGNPKDAVSTTIAGFTKASEWLVTGRKDGTDEQNAQDPGLIGGFMNFIRDPQVKDKPPGE